MGQIGGSINAVAVEGNYAYVALGPRLVVLDISDPTKPTKVGQTGMLPVSAVWRHAPWNLRLLISDPYVYLVDPAEELLVVVDTSDPTNPRQVGYYDTPGNAKDAFGFYVYLVDKLGLRLVDMSDPRDPRMAAYYETKWKIEDVSVSGQYAYLAAGKGGLRIVDISAPANPHEVASCEWRRRPIGPIVVREVTKIPPGVTPAPSPTPAATSTRSSTPPPLLGGRYALGVCIFGSYAYVKTKDEGVRIVDISDPADPHEVGVVDSSDPASAHGERYYDCLQSEEGTISGHYRYVPDRWQGLRVVDVSDRANPHDAALYTSLRKASNVVVFGSYAYVAAGADLRVLDISDPTDPHEVATVRPLEERNLGYDTIDFLVSGSYAYLLNCPYCNGLRVLDISDPTNPREVGYYESPNERSSFSDLFVSGSYAYVADAGQDVLRVLDISNPTNPRLVAYDAVREISAVFVSGKRAYVTTVKAGRDHLLVVDVSDPTNPKQMGSYSCYNPQSIFVSGDYAYVAVDRGLRVLDVSDPTNLRSASYYDMAGRPNDVFISGSYA